MNIDFSVNTRSRVIRGCLDALFACLLFSFRVEVGAGTHCVSDDAKLSKTSGGPVGAVKGPLAGHGASKRGLDMFFFPLYMYMSPRFHLLARYRNACAEKDTPGLRFMLPFDGSTM